MNYLVSMKSLCELLIIWFLSIMKPSIPNGSRDFTPVEMAKRNYLVDTIRSVFNRHGFKQIESPSM